ncbi:MAG: glycosyl transferase family 90 [Rhabdochlamydiaceae bacterium]|nr:glycosyl transferase family 90 [Candidatus Amphrikana amoebophyrae]
MRKRLLLALLVLILPLLFIGFNGASKVKRFLYNHSTNILDIPVSEADLSRLLKKAPPPWMQSRIEKDLAKYHVTPITRKKLDSVYHKYCHNKIARFQIRSQKLTYQTTCKEHVRFKSVKHGLKQLCQIYPKLNVDFIVSFEDDMKNVQEPIFVFAKNKHNHNLILFPDFTCYAKETTTYAWSYSLRPKIIKASNSIPWSRKKELGFWRGGTTGMDLTDKNWESSNRCKVCTISRFHPKIIDAKFTSFTQIPASKRKNFYSHYNISPFVTPEEHLQYKYLISLDGNTCTYPGLQWRLQSNSLVFKPKSNEIQWYYEGLVPNYHYLALESDCSNLISKLNWARQHDNLAHKIARQSTQFANENLNQLAIYHYLALLLREYERVQVTHDLAVDSDIDEYTPFCRY